MAIDRLRLYLAVKVALAWHGVSKRVDTAAVQGQGGELGLFTDDTLLPKEYERCEALVWAELQRAFNACEHPPPIDMVLHCPRCHLQHIDAPDSEPSAHPDGRESQWTNPPHRSHQCHGCCFIWRPADVPTNGVRAVRTRGKKDS